MTTSRRWACLGFLGGMLGSAVSGCARVDERWIEQQAAPDPDLAPVTPLTGPGPDLGSDDASKATDAATNGLSVCDIHKLRINELQTGGVTAATDEFIELYNPCAAAVALQGGKIVYRAATSGGDNFVFCTFAAQTIPSHGYFVLANGGFPGAADIKPFQSAGGMAAAGGSIALKDPLDVVVDSIGWGTAVNAFVEGTATTAPVGGQSLARAVDGVDTNDNLADFRLATPTPGTAN